MPLAEYVVLLPEQEDFCREVAAERTRLNREAGRQNLLVDPTRPPIENEIAGVRAELVVRQYLGVDTSFKNMCFPAPDGGVDIECNGLTIDVKWSWRQDGLLIFNSPAKFRAQVAVLVTPYEGVLLQIAGVISRKRFFESFKWFESPFHEKPVYCMTQKELQPVYKLLQFLEKPRQVYA